MAIWVLYHAELFATRAQTEIPLRSPGGSTVLCVGLIALMSSMNLFTYLCGDLESTLAQSLSSV